MNLISVGRKDFLQDKTLFNVLWFVTKKCNYKCVYCGLKKDEAYIDFSSCEKIIQFINNLTDSGKKVIVDLGGGEILFHPEIVKIVNSLKVFKIRIKTNCSHGLDMFDYFLNSTKPEINIQAEYHYSFIWPEEYIEKVKFIASRIHFVLAKIFWDVRNKDYSLDVYNKTKKLENEFSNVKVYLDMPQHPFFLWEKEDYEFIKTLEQGKDFVITYEEDNQIKEIETSYPEAFQICKGKLENFSCNKNSCLIDSNGDIFNCVELFYKGKLLFNIFDNQPKNFYYERTCDFSNMCNNLVIPKRRR
jgi:MoaA/NifB/PqqE/SkfB family radical SAM enzyme